LAGAFFFAGAFLRVAMDESFYQFNAV